MVTTAAKTVKTPILPDHTQLPESDGTFVKNFQEHPQSLILTDSLGPVLQQLHPDGQYAIGQDCGIYWTQTDPPEAGAVAPDWFYIPGVPPMLDGQIRRSYVLWNEPTIPQIVLEFASGNGAAERNNTPLSRDAEGNLIKAGKFWVYEQVMKIPYYGIYFVNSGALEFYELQGGSYQLLRPNERGHYPIPPLGVELGVWRGFYLNSHQPWMRWWDERGNLLLLGEERAERERERADRERERAEQQQERAFRAEQAQRAAIPKLLALGLTTEQVAQTLSLTIEEVQQYSQ